MNFQIGLSMKCFFASHTFKVTMRFRARKFFTVGELYCKIFHQFSSLFSFSFLPITFWCLWANVHGNKLNKNERYKMSGAPRAAHMRLLQSRLLWSPLAFCCFPFQLMIVWIVVMLTMTAGCETSTWNSRRALWREENVLFSTMVTQPIGAQHTKWETVRRLRRGGGNASTLEREYMKEPHLVMSVMICRFSIDGKGDVIKINRMFGARETW